ncbi:prefoldin subunit 5 [Lethenteron reissneri]|uniref:prefoldin subunit 5 n=1 Tax=Lethenteron reissneri TaxID=7753 RepID=UPI002AB6C3CD|nr:prefoldin subunit 5 [Lethenteron reissneri]
MAVSLGQLPLQQLEALRTQLEQELDFLSTSVQQLKVAQTKFVESKECLSKLNKDNAGKELLVPLTSSMYVPGHLNDVEHVMVDIGTGYYVEKTVEEAKEFFQRKIDFLTKQIEKIQPVLQEKFALKQAVTETFNARVQQQLQAMQQQQPSASKA